MDASPLAEFPQEVLNSHAWLVAAILAGERPDPQTFMLLGAEVLTIDKMTTLQCRTVDTTGEVRKRWQSALQCFQASAELWAQLSSDDKFVEGHARLLARLCCSASDMIDFYSIGTTDRSAYQRRKADPPPVAEGSNGAAA